MKAFGPMFVLGWIFLLGLYPPLLVSAHAASTAQSFAPPPHTAATSFFSLPPWITLAGHVEVETEAQRHFALDADQEDDVILVTPELSLEISLTPTTYLEAFIRLEPTLEAVLSEDETREESRRTFAFNLREAFVLLRPSRRGRVTVQVGRQTFADDRQWLYDDELDAARLVYQQERLWFELAVGRGTIANTALLGSDSTDATIYYLLYGAYAVREQINIAAYSIARDVLTSAAERLFFFGFRVQGQLTETLAYWLDVAHVRGQDASSSIRAWGLDVGLIYSPEMFLGPALIAGYAFGSGDDDPVGDIDTNFRQTGLQENETELHSVIDVKYYGALFDPELSNLHIFTLGLGSSPVANVSGHVLYHYYLQQQASTELRDVGIAAMPTGRSRHLGHEIDLVAGWASDTIELELVLGYFFPGKAFPDAMRGAFLSRLRIAWKF